jgi:hypothetical protein
MEKRLALTVPARLYSDTGGRVHLIGGRVVFQMNKHSSSGKKEKLQIDTSRRPYHDPMLRTTALRIPKTRILIPSYAVRNMSAPAQPAQQGWGNFIWTKLGYENLPQDVAEKSFYDLKAALPGKDRYINMVSPGLAESRILNE